jgi:hypothetical protein
MSSSSFLLMQEELGVSHGLIIEQGTALTESLLDEPVPRGLLTFHNNHNGRWLRSSLRVTRRTTRQGVLQLQKFR